MMPPGFERNRHLKRIWPQRNFRDVSVAAACQVDVPVETKPFTGAI
jgi:hypothetical protein